MTGKNRLIELLRQRDDFISGEEMGRLLGISRAAVWKNIKKLKEEGYIIDSVPNKGYRLISDADILEESIFKDIHTEIAGKKVYCYDKVGSTNDEAKKIASCQPEGTVVTANDQIQGKGRLGRQWEGGDGSAVYMSIILKPEIELSKAVQVTLLAGIAVARALRKLGLEAMIKWPNDVVIDGKKVCGILTELTSDIGSGNNMVLGIGINVNNESFAEDISDKATSLLLETGIKYRRAKIITLVLEEFDALYKIFRTEGIRPFTEGYKMLCVNIGREVQVVYSNKTIEGKAVDINDNGELIIQDKDGAFQTVFAGEVSVRGLYGYI